MTLDELNYEEIWLLIQAVCIKLQTATLGHTDRMRLLGYLERLKPELEAAWDRR